MLSLFTLNKKTIDLDEEYLYAEFMDLSLSDEEDEDETTVMLSTLEETERVNEHVLNFKVQQETLSVEFASSTTAC